MTDRFGGEVVNVDDYAKDYLMKLALHERDRLRSHSHQRDDEPSAVLQVAAVAAILGLGGWVTLSLIWRLIRRGRT